MDKDDRSLLKGVGVILLCALCFFGGMLYMKHHMSQVYTNYNNDTVHWTMADHGYEYCPYCGENIKE